MTILHRRSWLGLCAAIALTWITRPRASAWDLDDDEIVVWRGWILRRSDLPEPPP